MKGSVGKKWLLVLILTSVKLVSSANGNGQASPPPNVILIVADDLGWDDVSFHGSRQIPTPNIDALAYSGVILNNYYVLPLCSPTRSALLTGRHPIHTGMQQFVIDGSEPYGLGLNETLLSEYLKNMTYATHMVGKWHLGFFAKEYTPTNRHFDTHFGYFQAGEDYWNHKMLFNYNDTDYIGLDLHDGLKNIWNEDNAYSTEIFTSKAQQIIQNHNTSKPLFLYLAHQAVHGAMGDRGVLQAPQEYIDKFSYIKDQNRQIFAAMVSVLDDSVGNVTRTLHEKGMLENSIIIFTTDNGGAAYDYHGNWACNLPLRGRKYTVWEGGTRGVGFIWSPLLKKTGQVSDQLMHVTDWLPTILKAAGFNTTTLPKDLDGIDMWKTLNNVSTPSPRNETLYNIEPEKGSYAIRVGNYKLISEKEMPLWCPCPGISDNATSRYAGKRTSLDGNVVLMDKSEDQENAPEHMFSTKLDAIVSQLGLSVRDSGPVIVNCGPKPSNASTNCQPEKAPCLYDLSKDPCEYNNIADTKSKVVKQLQQKFNAMNATAVAPRNKPPDPKGLPNLHNNTWVPWVNLP